jgi:hypothetical protein
LIKIRCRKVIKTTQTLSNSKWALRSKLTQNLWQTNLMLWLLNRSPVQIALAQNVNSATVSAILVSRSSRLPIRFTPQ